MPAGSRRHLVAGFCAVALLLGACGGGGDEQVAARRPRGPSGSTSGPASTGPSAPGDPVAPLTGLAAPDALAALHPAVAVKIDNIDVGSSTARPQTGLNEADVVFEEIVEGGITRLVAVYQSRIPETVGPVRSARTTDVHLLTQLQRPLLAWAGGNAGVRAAVAGAPVVDVGFDAMPAAYQRDGSRKAPHNLYVKTPDLLARVGEGAAPPPLFAYRDEGEALGAGARPVRGLDVLFSGPGAAPVSYEWDGGAGGWRRIQRGTPHADAAGAVVAPANVLVMFVTYGTSFADSDSPEAQTVGGGEVWLFTRGQVVVGTWTRPDPAKPAELRDQQGQPLELTPGTTWVELINPGQATVVE